MFDFKHYDLSRPLVAAQQMLSKLAKRKKNQMTLMYIVGTGSKHDNIELRLSLRSVAKFATGVTRVIVVGNPPDWLSDDVQRIEIKHDIALSGRNRAITMNVLEGVRRADLHGDFVLGIDDVFLLEPVDFTSMPTFAAAEHLPSVNPTGGSWGAAMVECGEWLRNHGYRDVNFMTHAHIRMNADVILRHFDEIERTALTNETVRGLDILSLVGNMTYADLSQGLVRDFRPRFRCDFKLAKFDLTGVGDSFSISDKIFTDPKFIDFMNDNFGWPCRYERSVS